MKNSLIILLLFPGLALAACSKVIQYGLDDWPPYQYRELSGRPIGLDHALVTAVFEQVGCQVNNVEAPWARLMLGIEHGDIDVVSGASYSRERASFSYFSDELRQEIAVMFTRKDFNKPIQHWQDLRTQSINIATERGSFWGSGFQILLEDKAYKEYINFATRPKQLLNMLQKSYVEGIISDYYTGLYYINTYNFHDVKVQLVLQQAPVYVIMSKASLSEQDKATFNKGLALIKANGMYDKIIKEYETLKDNSHFDIDPLNLVN